MQRIYLSETSLSDELVITQKDLYHQITRVMRARVGQKYAFFDSIHQQDFIYEILSIDKQKVIFKLVEIQEKNSESRVNLHLFQALPHKLEKLEYIIEKGVEVGYRSFTFFPSERSQKLALSDRKQERLAKIMIEALEQCGGNILPELHFLEHNIILHGDTQYTAHLQNIGDIQNIFCHTVSQEIGKLTDLQVKQDIDIGIYIGPEGGLSDREVEVMQENGFIGINFGFRVLRCETVSSVVGFYLSQI